MVAMRGSEARSELAHVARVTTLGEMAASIAHEVNQPLAAIVNNASACLALLSHERADVEELRALCARHDVPMSVLGTTGGDALVVEGQFEVAVDELRTVWTATLPAALG